MPEEQKTIVVVGHGSRLAEANRDFEAFVHRFGGMVPDRQIKWGYIELAEPLLEKALEEAAEETDEVILLPLFLFAAGHVKKDIPSIVQEVQQRHPQATFQVARPLGVDLRMARLISKRLDESLSSLGKTCDKTVVIMVGRGSSDVDANSDFYKLVRILEESSHYAWVIPCFVAITHPQLGETLKRVVRENPEAILIQPYLLFPGRLVHQIQNEVEDFSKLHPQIAMKVCSPLGEDPLIFELLKERIHEVESKEREKRGQATFSIQNRLDQKSSLSPFSFWL